MQPRRGAWTSLPPTQRAAWEALGWTAESWEDRQSPPPESSLKRWSQLSSAQQAAALHGLVVSKNEWDAMVGSFIEISRKDSSRLPRDYDKSKHMKTVPASCLRKNETKDESLASRVARVAWNVAKAVAPQTVDTLSERVASPVVVNGLETTLYLDDSPSMREWTGVLSFSSRLDEGKKVLTELAPLLGQSPCRILKFSNIPTVLSKREEKGAASLPQISTGWDGTGNGTYLWHMIQTDVLTRYRPGTGKLRLVVVTDGEDNMSPPGYQGMEGMHPLMRTLQEAGYDIEWHIIVLGHVHSRVKEQYRALAGATGGNFLSVKRDFDKNSREASAFLKAFKNSGETGDTSDRRKRQRQYEKDSLEGKADRFDWYKQLPPPDNKK
jgi:hypothetical protein